MHKELIHLYGPFAINTFGLCIIIGIVLFSILFLSDPKRPKIISTQTYFNGLSLTILTALIGGRLLFVITHWQSLESFWDIFAIWQGGFSLLGTVIALMIVLPLYLKKQSLNVLALLDLATIYVPLLQSISRIGCFCAGCCFGIPTKLPFGIINPECSIESYLHQPLHPTQLYSSALLFLIFLSMYFIFQKYCKKPGQLLCIYLLLISAERFIVDFWRGDREYFSAIHLLSIPQLVCIGIFGAAVLGFCIITFLPKHRS